MKQVMKAFTARQRRLLPFSSGLVVCWGMASYSWRASLRPLRFCYEPLHSASANPIEFLCLSKTLPVSLYLCYNLVIGAFSYLIYKCVGDWEMFPWIWGEDFRSGIFTWHKQNSIAVLHEGIYIYTLLHQHYTSEFILYYALSLLHLVSVTEGLVSLKSLTDSLTTNPSMDTSPS